MAREIRSIDTAWALEAEFIRGGFDARILRAPQAWGHCSPFDLVRQQERLCGWDGLGGSEKIKAELGGWMVDRLECKEVLAAAQRAPGIGLGVREEARFFTRPLLDLSYAGSNIQERFGSWPDRVRSVADGFDRSGSGRDWKCASQWRGADDSKADRVGFQGLSLGWLRRVFNAMIGYRADTDWIRRARTRTQCNGTRTRTRWLFEKRRCQSFIEVSIFCNLSHASS